eukprot:Gb_06693 [translate_table: standard]
MNLCSIKTTATVELARFFHRHFFYKFKNHKQIHTGVFRNANSLIHHSESVGILTRKSKWESQANSNVSPLFREFVMEKFDSNTYASILQACTNVKLLNQVHARMIISGLEENSFLESKLVGMYAIYGSIQHARLLFDKMAERNVFLWNAMIKAYARCGYCEETLALYYEMQGTGIDPDNFTFAFALKACAGLSALHEGREIHYHIMRAGFESDIYVETALIDMYTKCNSVENARQVFDKMAQRNVVSWTAMIAGYSQNGHCKEALILYHQMQQTDVKPNSITKVAALKACGHLGALKLGKSMHGNMIKTEFELNVFVMTSLIDMYTKCGSVEDARHVFDKMSRRNVVSWTAMIAGYAQNGYSSEALSLFHQMAIANVPLDSVTLVSALLACAHVGALQQGRWIHDYIIRSGFELDVFVQNSLINMYVKCDCIDVASQLFKKMSRRDVVSWNVMIGGYAQNGLTNEAFSLFHQMRLKDVTPDSTTMSSLLSICALLRALRQGKCIHNYIIRYGFESDVFNGVALIDMYAKCGATEDAHQCFDLMPRRDVVSWNALIAGYSQNGHANEVLTLFHRMQLAGTMPNAVTVVSVLPACAQLGDLQQGKWIHDYIIRSRFESDSFVMTTLIDMYAKCGSIHIARQLFDRMCTRNVVSWTAMITGYAQNGHANEALTLFNQMQLAGVKPNSVTMVSVLSACAHLGALEQGKWFHNYIIRRGFESDAFVVTALIDMYAKCGRIVIARQLFDNMSEENVFSWSAMIAGYGIHGHVHDALALFNQMQHLGINPNDITFISVLSACRHAGLVDEGWKCFECMTQKYGITPRAEHYACMVDLLGRSGHLHEAQDFISKMPLPPDAGVWGALLGACRIHCDIELGQHVAEHLFELDPENAGHYVLLSNIYAAAGRWDNVAKVRTMMKSRGLKKTPGRSFIEVNNKVHEFVVGDRSHPQSEKIYEMLEALAGQMEDAGYACDTSFVLHDVEEEEKDYILCSHSEKLAIAFGLISTSPGTPIQITKNLRVCGDCHSAAKFISKINNRDIIMRDANRFHHFKDGLCSCRDYW